MELLAKILTIKIGLQIIGTIIGVIILGIIGIILWWENR